jgi:hypothetical protein
MYSLLGQKDTAPRFPVERAIHQFVGSVKPTFDTA